MKGVTAQLVRFLLKMICLAVGFVCLEQREGYSEEIIYFTNKVLALFYISNNKITIILNGLYSMVSSFKIGSNVGREKNVVEFYSRL